MILPQLPDCKGCALHSQGCKSVGIPTFQLSNVEGSPIVVFMGHQPGREEDVNAQPFCGPSGRMLRSVYIEALRLHENCSVYLTNVVRCWPVGLDKPKPAHIKACHGHLAHDLSYLSTLPVPKFLVLLGSEASQAILDKKLTAALKNNCSEWSPPWLPSPWTTICTYHPAYLLSKRNPNAIRSVGDHLQLLLDRLSGIPIRASSPRLRAPGPPPPLV